jgi:hypothetical protein
MPHCNHVNKAIDAILSKGHFIVKFILTICSRLAKWGVAYRFALIKFTLFLRDEVTAIP